MKTYRQHNCTRNHRTYATFAKCVWGRNLIWVQGEGQYASVSKCGLGPGIPSYRRGVTVELHASEKEAENAKKLIDSTACGGLCSKQHEVVRLDLGRA